MSKFYLTTTIPYVNADPHIGFALEIVQADIIARYHRLIGDDVIFNTGTDEHGLKIFRKAEEEKKTPQEYVDEQAKRFNKLKEGLNLSYTNFTRTTDKDHIEAAQEFWKICDKNGYIYKKNYKIKYCVGCELEKTESELVNNRCPIHPNLELEIIEEENYFFKFKEFQKSLLEFYSKNPEFVVPDFRFNEIKQFVKKGLKDFSISRLKEKMPWGISVPNDKKHVIYVWFDALINYVSTLGWPKDKQKFNDYWPGIQLAGKDNLRQQSAMWQAMLMATGLPNSKQIIIHGFITSNGQKMSKSLGNVIDPFEIVKRYGTDALRYYLAKEVSPFEDSDFTWEKFIKTYNSDLANGLGNLVARVAKLCETIENNYTIKEFPTVFDESKFPTNIYSDYEKKYLENFKKYQFNEVLNALWEEIKHLDMKIQEVKPWEYSKQKDRQKEIKLFLLDTVSRIKKIATYLEPFLPETSEKIKKQFEGPKIQSQTPLFPRIK